MVLEVIYDSATAANCDMDNLLPTEFTVLMNTYVTSSLDASFFAILLLVHFWLIIYLLRVLRHILV